MLSKAVASAVSTTLTPPKYQPLKRVCCVSSDSSFKWTNTNAFEIFSTRKQHSTLTGSKRMEKLATRAASPAAAAAQPLKNADELIDSVETFIFDCDGYMIPFLAFSVISLFSFLYPLVVLIWKLCVDFLS